MNIHVYVHSYIGIPINYGKQNHTSARRKASTWSQRWGKRRADGRARGGQNEGDEEERNYDKGCWQTVTGTTLSATRFCAYHSPPVHHRRHRCHPRPIWSDLNLLRFKPLPLRSPYICISAASFFLHLPVPFFFPLPPSFPQRDSLFTLHSCCLFLTGGERERHTARWNRRDDSGIEHRSGLIVGCSVLKRYIHTAYGSFL